jgi:hypothetical protein
MAHRGSADVYVVGFESRCYRVADAAGGETVDVAATAATGGVGMGASIGTSITAEPAHFAPTCNPNTIRLCTAKSINRKLTTDVAPKSYVIHTLHTELNRSVGCKRLSHAHELDSYLCHFK